MLSEDGSLRQRLWPAVGWPWHLLALAITLSTMLLAYSNSVTTLVQYNDDYPDSGYTLDNKYIIQLDPRTKADTWDDVPGQPIQYGTWNIWTKDYWWPKGISGLYRPIITWTYWFNWHVIGGDESVIDVQTQLAAFRKIDQPTRLRLLHEVLAALDATAERSVASASEDVVYAKLRETARDKIGDSAKIDSRKIDTALSNLLYGRIDTESRVRLLSEVAGPEKTSGIDPKLEPAAREQLLAQRIRTPQIDEIRHRRYLWFHIINLVAHAITAMLVYLTALLLTQRYWTALAIGTLFAVHPVTVESVTNTIGRADIFAAITVLGGLLLHVTATSGVPFWKPIARVVPIWVYVPLLFAAVIVARLVLELGSPWAIGAAVFLLLVRIAVYALRLARWGGILESRVWDRLGWGFLLALLLTFGLFSKESAIALVGVMFIYDWIYRWNRRQFWYAVVAMLIAAVTGGICYLGIISLSKAIPAPWAGAIILVVIAGALTAVLVPSRQYLRQEPWNSLVHYLALILPLVLLAVARHMVFEATTPPEEPFLDNPIRGVNWFAGRLTAMDVIVRLWWLILFPVNLSSDYSFNEVRVFGLYSSALNDLFCLLAAVLVLGVLVLAVWYWIKNVSRPAAFFILFFFATAALTANMVINIGSIMAERFMYLPVVGFVGCLVLGIEWLGRRAVPKISGISDEDRPLAHVGMCSLVAGIVVVLYGARTYNRNLVWRSDVTLWESAIQISKNSFRSYQSYAFALFEELQKTEAPPDQLDRPEHKRQPQTKDMSPQALLDKIIETAAGARPIVDQLPDRLNSSRLYLHLGMYYGLKGDKISTNWRVGGGSDIIAKPEAAPFYEKSIEALEHAVPVDRTFNAFNRQKEILRGKEPHNVPDVGLLQVYQYLGSSYSRMAQFEQRANPSERPEYLSKALESYLYMRRLDPTNPDAYVCVAQVYMQMNTPQYVAKHPREATVNAEQAAIALIQTLWLDNSREVLWQPIAGLLQQLNHEPQPAVVQQQGQAPRLDMQRQVVQTVLCQVYMSFVRTFMESRVSQMADYFRKQGIETGFPPGVFDDIYREFKRTPPPVPTKPAPGAVQPGQAPPPPPKAKPAATEPLNR